jgi:hypothetical protein
MFSRSTRPINSIPTPADNGQHLNSKTATVELDVLSSSVSIYYRTQDINTSGLATAILHFQCRLISVGSTSEFINQSDIKNLRTTFRNLFLSIIEREIQKLPVWWPLSCTPGVGRCRNDVHKNSISNYISIYYGTRDTSSFGLVAASWCFRFISML